MENNTIYNFMLKEYEFVKGEIVSSVNEINILARYAILFCGGILTFVFANNYDNVFKQKYGHFLIWLPFGLAAIFALRSYFLGKRIDILGLYIRNVEKLLYKNNTETPMGWEHFLEESLTSNPLRIGNRKIKKSGLQVSTFLFYALILVITFLIPFIS